MAARGEALKEQLLGPPVRAGLVHLVVDRPQAGTCSRRAATLLRAASPARRRHRRGSASTIQNDPELQAKIDGWVERTVVYLLDQYRDEVADLISGTVARWDADDASRRIELQVGRDLQYIRINGTVVGGLAGLVIHAATHLF